MSQDTENFDSLRRLLAIKRHEQPPPGYFHSFSGEVIMRIKAGERGEDAHGYIWQMGWLQRIWGAFEARPALAGALGLAACGLVVFGVISADSDKLDQQTVAPVPTTEMQSVARNDAGDSLSALPGMDASKPSLFDLVPKQQADPSSLHLTLGNVGN